MKVLHVLLHGQHVADLIQEDSGSKKLAYLPALDPSVSLSVALPYRTTPYGNKPTMAFIEGLIPEGEGTRQALQRQFNLSSWKNPFLFLEHIGLDCAGAVQFVPERLATETAQPASSLHPISHEEVGERLRRLARGANQSWVMQQEHWSLAGAQSKFALRREGTGWYEAHGAEPTTHIIKPGIHTLKDQALNEHLCLSALGRLGLSVARTEFIVFDGMSALVVERYDRIRTEHSVFRMHQEDFCQAFSVLPEKKYESAGGPSAVQIVELLSRVSSQNDVEKFVQALIANYLLGAPDAHAKNYSLLHLPGAGTFLAPLYDVASALPYGEEPVEGFPGKETGWRKAAMRIGGESRFGRLSRKHWNRFARDAGLEEERVRGTVRLIAESLPHALQQACDDESAAIGDSDLPERLLPAIEQLCANTLTRLDRDD